MINDLIVYTCKGCREDIHESKGDHLLICEGNGWNKKYQKDSEE